MVIKTKQFYSIKLFLFCVTVYTFLHIILLCSLIHLQFLIFASIQFCRKFATAEYHGKCFLYFLCGEFHPYYYLLFIHVLYYTIQSMNGMSTRIHIICVVFQWNIISIVILSEISITQVYCLPWPHNKLIVTNLSTPLCVYTRSVYSYTQNLLLIKDCLSVVNNLIIHTYAIFRYLKDCYQVNSTLHSACSLFNIIVKLPCYPLAVTSTLQHCKTCSKNKMYFTTQIRVYVLIQKYLSLSCCHLNITGTLVLHVLVIICKHSYVCRPKVTANNLYSKGVSTLTPYSKTMTGPNFYYVITNICLGSGVNGKLLNCMIIFNDLNLILSPSSSSSKLLFYDQLNMYEKNKRLNCNLHSFSFIHIQIRILVLCVACNISSIAFQLLCNVIIFVCIFYLVKQYLKIRLNDQYTCTFSSNSYFVRERIISYTNISFNNG